MGETREGGNERRPGAECGQKITFTGFVEEEQGLCVGMS